MDEKLFTQDEVNRIVQERIAREKQKEVKVSDAADSEEESIDYKTEALDLVKKVSLLNEGVPYEKVDHYTKYVKGSSESEIKSDARELAKDLENKKKNYTEPGQKKGAWNPFTK
ncbi:hypothetical protein J0K78_17025 [Halobacillus sp. GSS1]|uniref:hypothetical protein n=1 Tax=Halobacillus sp. GSS1 TaxID=2815919 RepID=UPI001A8C5AE2|nr:hypothetical protein [Halobacillus sp. GSS1]MBN9655981.1 hypothetical protein [Halobacillus sp. GSS1]